MHDRRLTRVTEDIIRHEISLLVIQSRLVTHGAEIFARHPPFLVTMLIPTHLFIWRPLVLRADSYARLLWKKGQTKVLDAAKFINIFPLSVRDE